MEEKFKYIVDLGEQFLKYETDPELLFSAINDLPEKTIEEILDEYGDSDLDFKPVNLVRAEVAYKAMNGVKITEELIKEIKSKIVERDLSYFENYSKDFLEKIRSYKVTKRDPFANWQNHWKMFHTFFYRDSLKTIVNEYLESISVDMMTRLGLMGYLAHNVDFYGPSNFGQTYCWIALYPAVKDNHQQSCQFFARIGSDPEAGKNYGSKIRKKTVPIINKVADYEGVISVLSGIKDEISSENEGLKNFFKFAPGKQASEWDNFHDEGIIAINFDGILGRESIESWTTQEDLNLKLGLDKEARSNNAMNLWLFKTASIGDVVFATKGANICIGVGVIKGTYYFSESDAFRHRREVEWITDKVYHYKSNSLQGCKNLFRIDTFSPTTRHEFIIEEYVNSYPELESVFIKNNLMSRGVDENNKSIDYIEPEEEEVPEVSNFWWLNANPKIWSISDHAEGEKQSYTTHNEKGNKRRIYKHFTATKPRDLIVGYETSPTKQIKAIYEVTQGVHTVESEERIEFVLIEKLEVPVSFNDLKNIVDLKDCEVFKNNQGSLFKLTEEEYDIIHDVIDTKNIISNEIVGGDKTKAYEYSNDPDKPFISEDEFHQSISLLKRKKNIILQGPPGVGKTFIARKLAYEMMRECNDDRIDMVQFHQSYSYEDFIQGLRPSKGGTFDLRDGIFHTFCLRALAHPEKDFFFIIDEINRGNLSKIFGELMMLIEADKRNKKFAMKLTYAEDEEDRFFVPDNLYIIGTMNTADRSLALVDYALRRRFAFVSLKPYFDDNFKEFLKGKGMSVSLVEHICKSVTAVNKQIVEDMSLGEGFQIGHSYFCAYSSELNEDIWWDEIIKFELKPMLEEIWFDDLTKVSDVLVQLSR